jgi:hypothetical protein
MQFEELWTTCDFTEAEIIEMGWQRPFVYMLRLNYYWASDPHHTARPAPEDRYLTLAFHSCTRLEIIFHVDEWTTPPHYGTIVGWERVVPSP